MIINPESGCVRAWHHSESRAVNKLCCTWQSLFIFLAYQLVIQCMIKTFNLNSNIVYFHCARYNSSRHHQKNPNTQSDPNICLFQALYTSILNDAPLQSRKQGNLNTKKSKQGQDPRLKCPSAKGWSVLRVLPNRMGGCLSTGLVNWGWSDGRKHDCYQAIFCHSGRTLQADPQNSEGFVRRSRDRSPWKLHELQTKSFKLQWNV